MSRHELLSSLHRALQPRTYFEVGIADGASMALSRTCSIGVDPAFKVTRPLECDVQLVRVKSDEFFAGDEAFSHFGRTPVDLAFIDGLHLSEFALRDFMNTEKVMSRAGVVVIDDLLPRNALEAARDRKTGAWCGDVYKVLMILKEQRPDLAVIPVNTSPTGTAVVVGLDPDSRVLEDNYDDNLRHCEQPDPQAPPDWILHRTAAVAAGDVAEAPWADLAAVREDPTPEAVRSVIANLPR